MSQISYYENTRDRDGLEVDFSGILKAIKEGTKWEQKVMHARELASQRDMSDSKEEHEKYHKKLSKFKQTKLPALTVSGTFAGGHSKDNLKEHSGLIAIDIDDIDNVNETFQLIKKDKYTRALFRSVSGTGLCVVVRITPSKHYDSFLGLERHYLKQYNIGIDQSCKDVSRLRFISHDPQLYYNADSPIFKDYVKKKKGRKSNVPQTYFNDDNDFQFVLDQIHSGRVDITSDYMDWVNIAFAIKSEYGSTGEKYFHEISQYHHGYDEKQARAKYRSASAQGATNIATFYHIAKKNGLQIKTKQSKQISRAARFGRKRGATAQQVQKQLKEVDDIEPSRSSEIIEQTYQAEAVDDPDEEDIVEEVQQYIRLNYDIIYNEVTMKYTEKGEPLSDRDMNSVYLDVKQSIEKATQKLVFTIIDSDRTDAVNPVIDFFKDNASQKPKGPIKKIAESIDSPTGFGDGTNFAPNFVEHFLRKWAVGAVAMWHGRHSPLVFILAGQKKGTGKTHFLRYLMPDELQKYYGEFDMNGSKDERIMMCNKIMLMNDDIDLERQADVNTVKSLCSAQWFNVRKPYGKTAEDLRRLAALCGTSNDKNLLQDPAGNRRIIPIEVLGIDHDMYNSVDKVSFWMEAYKNWKNGYDWKLSKEDVDLLEKHTGDFEETSIEAELIMEAFQVPQKHHSDSQIQYLSSTEIKDQLERYSEQRLSIVPLGKQMSKLGFEQKRVSLDDNTRKRAWIVVERTSFGG